MPFWAVLGVVDKIHWMKLLDIDRDHEHAFRLAQLLSKSGATYKIEFACI